MPEQQSLLYKFKICLSIYVYEFNSGGLQSKDMLALFRELFERPSYMSTLKSLNRPCSICFCQSLICLLFSVAFLPHRANARSDPYTGRDAAVSRTFIYDGSTSTEERCHSGTGEFLSFLFSFRGHLFKINDVVSNSLKFQMAILQIHNVQRILTCFQQNITVHLLLKLIYIANKLRA